MQKRFSQTLWRRGGSGARRVKQAAKRGQLGRASPPLPWRPTLVGAAVARADDDDRHWKRKRHHHSPPHYVAAPPVAYYAPRPIVYAPPPIVYYPAADGLRTGLWSAGPSISALPCRCVSGRSPIGHKAPRPDLASDPQTPPCRHNPTRTPVCWDDSKLSSRVVTGGCNAWTCAEDHPGRRDRGFRYLPLRWVPRRTTTIIGATSVGAANTATTRRARTLAPRAAAARRLRARARGLPTCPGLRAAGAGHDGAGLPAAGRSEPELQLHHPAALTFHSFETRRTDLPSGGLTPAGRALFWRPCCD